MCETGGQNDIFPVSYKEFGPMPEWAWMNKKMQIILRKSDEKWFSNRYMICEFYMDFVVEGEFTIKLRLRNKYIRERK